jgi:hypothetical protein
VSTAPVSTSLRGRGLLNDPTLNKGTAFASSERQAHGLGGLLPPRIETTDEQCARLRDKFDRLYDDLERHIFLRALQDTNQVLFYAFAGRPSPRCSRCCTRRRSAWRANSSVTSTVGRSGCS